MDFMSKVILWQQNAGKRYSSHKNVIFHKIRKQFATTDITLDFLNKAE